MASVSRLDKLPISDFCGSKAIVGWLEQGDYVVIHNGSVGRSFHKCLGDIKSTEQMTAYLDSNRVIYIDVSNSPGLLANEEWPDDIKKAGFLECVCRLRERVSDSNGLPHAYHLFKYDRWDILLPTLAICRQLQAQEFLKICKDEESTIKQQNG